MTTIIGGILSWSKSKKALERKVPGLGVACVGERRSNTPPENLGAKVKPIGIKKPVHQIRACLGRRKGNLDAIYVEVPYKDCGCARRQPVGRV
jgi:hypothetical protein